MPAQAYTMNNEEFEIYSAKAREIYESLENVPTHLISSILIKVLVSIHLQLKGYTEETPGSKQLHDDLIRNISNELIDKTNRHIIERN